MDLEKHSHEDFIRDLKPEDRRGLLPSNGSTISNNKPPPEGDAPPLSILSFRDLLGRVGAGAAAFHGKIQDLLG